MDIHGREAKKEGSLIKKDWMKKGKKHKINFSVDLGKIFRPFMHFHLGLLNL
tara:strand:+ start:742 stop:897 length:156 start_codon:yes stop_codon:yes gene_type:complete